MTGIEAAIQALLTLSDDVLERPSPLFNPIRDGIIGWGELPVMLIPQIEKRDGNEWQWWQNAQMAVNDAVAAIAFAKHMSTATVGSDPSIDTNALRECVHHLNRAIKSAIEYSHANKDVRDLLFVEPIHYKPSDLPKCVWKLKAVARTMSDTLRTHYCAASSSTNTATPPPLTNAVDAIPNSQPTTTTGVTTTTATTTDAAGATATGAKQQNGNAADAESVSTAHAKPSKTGQSPNSPGLLTVNEFAAVAKVSKKTIYRLCADEVAPLPHTRLGKTIRIDADKALRHLHHLKMDGHSDASEPQNRPSRVTKTGNRKFNPSRTIPGTGIKRRS